MERLKNKNLYYVGGVVRDEILGIPNIDVDYCYEGNAIQFAQKLNIIKTNESFGTVRIMLDSKEIDIASTRNETYPRKGHLPQVYNIGCSLKEDLERRDFTINAMAKRTTDGEIFDYFRGRDDIKNKCLRVLHENSFIDDPTRIIRGLKFAVRFGFELDEKTKQLQNDYLSNINYDMSYARLKKELIDAFSLNKAEVFRRFINEGLYKLLGREQVKPKIEPSIIEKELESYEKNNIWLIYLSFFNLSNFNLTRQEKKILEWADRLEKEKFSNNTPKESLIIHKLRMKQC